MAERPTYSLTIPSDLSMLTAARSFVESVGVSCGLDRSVVHALVLVTGEAVTNIIRHAHRDRPTAQLHAQFQLLNDRVVLNFFDQGDPFDITQVPYLAPGEMRIGGRGVFLMRALTDELTCQPRGPGQPGNCLRMVKFLHKATVREVG